MSDYQRRLGIFRKANHPLKIYKTVDIPVRDVVQVLRTAKKVKIEEAVECPNYQMTEEKDSNKHIEDLLKQRSRDLKWSRFSPDICDPRGIYQPKVPKDFSRVPMEQNLYKQCYDDSTVPRFPITSSPGFTLKSDSEESEPESDLESEYEIDSEDEEWLEKNKESNITPSRLEYVFTKLNKRNTHVTKLVIGTLPHAFHEDFGLIFPYWKEKRLQNKNKSSFRRNQSAGTMKKDTGLPSGYDSSDPNQIFTCIPAKSRPRKLRSTLLEGTHDKKDKETHFKRMIEMRKQLAKATSWAVENLHSSINARSKIVNKFASLMHDQGAVRSEKRKCKKGRNEKSTESVKPANVPVKVSGSLTNQRKKITLIENSINAVAMKGDDPTQTRKELPLNFKSKKEETRLGQGKKWTKPTTSKTDHAYRGKNKNKKSKGKKKNKKSKGKKNKKSRKGGRFSPTDD